MSPPPGRVRLGQVVLTLLVAAAGTAYAPPATAKGEDSTAHKPKTYEIAADALKRGHPPRVIWVGHGVVHRPGHRAVRVRGIGKDLGIFGYSRGRYIVSDSNWFPTKLYRVGPRGKARQFYRSPDTIGKEILVARKAGLLYTLNSRGTGMSSTFRRVDARTGKVRRIKRRHRPPALLDVHGRRAVLGGMPRAELWTKKGRIRRIVRGRAVFASIADNRIAVRKGRRTVMRRIDGRHRTLWTARNIYPRDISPNGHRLISLGEGGKSITVSRMRDGRPTHRFEIYLFHGNLEPDTLQWESDRSFLVVFENENTEVASMRCRLDGRCKRATRYGDPTSSVDLVTQTPGLP